MYKEKGNILQRSGEAMTDSKNRVTRMEQCVFVEENTKPSCCTRVQLLRSNESPNATFAQAGQEHRYRLDGGRSFSFLLLPETHGTTATHCSVTDNAKGLTGVFSTDPALGWLVVFHRTRRY